MRGKVKVRKEVKPKITTYGGEWPEENTEGQPIVNGKSLVKNNWKQFVKKIREKILRRGPMCYGSAH